MLQAALDQGIEIPHFCYHPALSPAGNCRMCMVEIEAGGRRQMTTACTSMPTDGMVVNTDTEQVIQTRKAMMEFLFINHPLGCPVCDQAGECILQDYGVEHGAGESRFVEQKLVQPKKDIGEHILLYSDRCIRCTRCIRFCDEIPGTGELGYFHRGVHSEVDIFPGIRLDNRMSGNVVDVCPVGALLDKDFLFKQRVWFLEEVPSVCPRCSTGCSIWLHRNNNVLYRINPRVNPEVNGYWICDDGRYGWEYVMGEHRLETPMRRVGDDLVPTSWEEALEAVQEGLSRVKEERGTSALAGFASGHLTCEENYLFGKFLRDVMGTDKVGIRVRRGEEETFLCGFTIEADKTPNLQGTQDMLKGLGLEVMEASEIWEQVEQGAIRGLYVLGGSPEEPLTEDERRALGRVDFLVVQDISRSELASMAHLILPGAAFSEKDGTFTNSKGRVQRIRWAFSPPGEAKADWEVLRDVAEQLGGDFDYFSAREVMDEIGRCVPGYKGMSYESLGETGRLVERSRG